MHLSTPFHSLTGYDRWDLRVYARAMPLVGGVKSIAGQTLVDTLIDTIVIPFWKPTKQMRPTSLLKARAMLSAFLPDLLAATKAGKWGRCRTGNASLAKAPGGRRAFQSVRTALVTSGHIEEIPGFKKTSLRSDGSGDETSYEITCFRPTEKLLNLASDGGVALDSLPLHFAPSRSHPLTIGDALVLRARKPRKGTTGLDMPIDATCAAVKVQRTRMDSLNAFLKVEGRVSGILFGGLRRIFNDGDQENFNWQWGGRFYSMPGWDQYELMKHGKDTRAACIRLDGEEVVEVDMSAAALTILYALLEVPIEGPVDLYAVEGFEGEGGRDQVKEWVKIALGMSSSIAGGNKFKRVREATIARHSILGQLEAHGIGTLELQYHESEIVLSALEELRDRYGVAGLPVHDCLMVPKSRRGLARQVLVDAFQRYFREVLGRSVVPVPIVS